MPYTPTDWVDNVTPVNAANMDHIEAGLDAATDTAEAAETQAATAQTTANAAQAAANAAIAKAIVDAKGDIIAASAADTPVRVPLGSDGQVLVARPALANGLAWEPAPASGSSIEYENAWAAGTPYTPGDVVIHNGIEYLAVNPSTGVTPPTATGASVPLVTALPGSPVDGQECILVDSLTAPTFSWHFRYVAAKASNKWIFLGGSPIVNEVVTEEWTTSTTYVDLTTVGPAVVLPVAGDYEVGIGAHIWNVNGTMTEWMSFAIGATAASDNDSIVARDSGAAQAFKITAARTMRKNGLGAVTLTAKYRTTGNAATYAFRWISVRPFAVGG